MADGELINSPHVDEGTMHAWLDGELSVSESDAVELHIANCATCSAAAAEARGLIAASTRILSALDDVPGDVIPAKEFADYVARGTTPLAVSRVRSRSVVRRYAPIAAVAAFAIAATLVLRRNPTPIPQQSSAATQSVKNAAGAAPLEPTPAPKPKQQSKPTSQPTRQSTAASTTAPTAPPKPEVATASAILEDSVHADRVAKRSRTAMPSSTERIATVLSEPSSHASESLAITGRVTAAATGLPLVAARVSVEGTDASVATDSNGAFTIAKLLPGTHTLMARQVGFAASKALVEVPPDRPANVTFALPRTPGALSLSDIELTGVAAGVSAAHVDGFSKSPPTMLGARIVSSSVRDEGDSRVRRTTYQIGAGAPVVLAEYRSAHATSIVRQRFDTTSSAMHLMLREPSQAAHSVTWTASDSTVFVLSGSMSESELEGIKRRIVP